MELGKNILFDPNKIQETDFCTGAHYMINPKGIINIFNSSYIFFLHLKFLGVDYVMKRYQLLNNRLSNDNKKNGWGVQYKNYDKQSILIEYEKNKKAEIALLDMERILK